MGKKQLFYPCFASSFFNSRATFSISCKPLYCLRLSVGKSRNNPSAPELESTLRSFEKPYRCDVTDLKELSHSDLIGKKAEFERPKNNFPPSVGEHLLKSFSIDNGNSKDKVTN